MQLETDYLNRGARTGSRWFGLLSAFSAPFLMAGAMTLEKQYGRASLLAMLFFVAMLAGGFYLVVRSNQASRARISVSEKGIDHDGVLLAREKIDAARFAPAVRGRPPSVSLVGRGGSEIAWLGVKSQDEGERVLAALGLPAGRSTAQFSAMADVGFTGFGIVLALSLLFTVLGGVLGVVLFGLPQLGALLTIVPMLVLNLFVVPAKVYVGGDGLLWKTRFKPRFFAWKDVLRVEPQTRGIRVVLKSGPHVDIPITPRSLREFERVTQAAMVTRANDALAAYNRGDVPDVTARVARLGRTKEEWIKALRDREGTFRDAPIRSDDLWRIVESPSADHTARAGAAAMLAEEATPEDRTRLRIAADTCAEPRLRVVLAKAAAGDDPLELIGEVEDDEHATAAR